MKQMSIVIRVNNYNYKKGKVNVYTKVHSNFEDGIDEYKETIKDVINEFELKGVHYEVEGDINDYNLFIYSSKDSVDITLHKFELDI